MTNQSARAPKRTSPRTKPKPKIRSEASEQMEVARVLRMNGILFAYIQNDNPSMKNKQYREKARRMGLLVGCPDILIFDTPTGTPGVALEMKRSDKDEKAVAQRQSHVHEQFRERNWEVIVAYGAQDAFDKLRALGYTLKFCN